MDHFKKWYSRRYLIGFPPAAYLNAPTSAVWHMQGRHQFDEQVYGGEMKEKLNGLCTMKSDGTGDMRMVLRNSLMWVACLALERTCPTFHQGSVGEMTPPLKQWGSDWLGCRRVDGLTNSDTTQVQIQGFELVHAYIFPIYELLEYMKGLVLQNEICRISITQGSNRIYKRSPNGDPVLIV